jgi:hypothetical protein
VPVAYLYLLGLLSLWFIYLLCVCVREI